jgi:alpha-glucoside transport system substrate-binding protein
MKRNLIRFSAVFLLLALALSMTILVNAQSEEDPLGILEDDRFHWEDLEQFRGYDMGGEEVIFFGPWLTGDEESIQNVVAYFNSVVTNGSVTYVGSDSFEQQIVIDVEGGNPPNIAAFPQPGLASNIASRGGLVPLGEEMEQYVLDNYAGGEGWVAFGTYGDENGEDQYYGMFYNVNLKSLVWYVPEVFEELGYEIPTTWDEMVALSDQIVEDGGTPWCIGVGSEAATGWPATDWVEDIMLRTAGLDVYQQWINNEIPFTDERVQNAIEMFGTIARNEDYVNGGAVGVQTTDFRESPAGLFTVPPECFMHRQASFISAFFPEDVEVGVDADFFYFPPIDEEMGNPVLGGGTLLTITNDTPATRIFLEYLSTPLAHELWMTQGAFLTPHTAVNTELYASDILLNQGEILLGADVFGFDGSDLMPGAIGAGAFWTAMVDYIGGASVEEVTQAVQDAWDALE